MADAPVTVSVHGIPLAPALVRQCNDIATDLGVKPLA